MAPNDDASEKGQHLNVTTCNGSQRTERGEVRRHADEGPDPKSKTEGPTLTAVALPPSCMWFMRQGALVSPVAIEREDV